jgi:hypothetical protein
VSTRGGSWGSLGVVMRNKPSLPASTSSFPTSPRRASFVAPTIFPFTPLTRSSDNGWVGRKRPGNDTSGAKYLKMTTAAQSNKRKRVPREITHIAKFLLRMVSLCLAASSALLRCGWRRSGVRVRAFKFATELDKHGSSDIARQYIIGLGFQRL